MSRPVTRLGKINRHQCCVCGRVRNAIYVTSAYTTEAVKNYESNWFSKPQINSHYCIDTTPFTCHVFK